MNIYHYYKYVTPIYAFVIYESKEISLQTYEQIIQDTSVNADIIINICTLYIYKYTFWG